MCPHPDPILWRSANLAPTWFQLPSDPPGSEPCFTMISLQPHQQTRGTVAGIQLSSFYTRKVPSYRPFWRETPQLCLVKSSQQLSLYKLSSCLMKREISFHPSHSLQWDHQRPTITSYCTFITVRLPVCEPPVHTPLYLPATNQYGECGSISHGKECKTQPYYYLTQLRSRWYVFDKMSKNERL